jgi:hypothetical protein
MITNEELEKIKKLCNHYNLSFSISNFKIIMQTDKNKGFSNKGIKVPIKDPQPGLLTIHISKDDQHKESLKNEEENNHIKFGSNLGYPECCCNFFKENYKEQSQNQNDFILPALKYSRTHPFQTNIIARYFDYTLLNHFPCSFDCQASIDLANKHLNIIRKTDLSLAIEIENRLKCATIYTETEGIHLLYNYKLENNILTFKTILSTAKTELRKDLEKEKALTIKDKNTIILNNKEITNIGIALFH